MPDSEPKADFWSKVFLSFRPEDQKFLVVSTSNGLEVAVQEIARVEEGLVIIRGRIAGTADSGRLFLLPFAQLSSVYVNRPVRMEEIDLFSPAVAPAQKLEVARKVAELERRAREDARMAEAAKNGDIDLADAMKKLDTLRDQAPVGEQPPAASEQQGLNPVASSAKPKVGRVPLLTSRAPRLTASEPSVKVDET